MASRCDVQPFGGNCSRVLAQRFQGLRRRQIANPKMARPKRSGPLVYEIVANEMQMSIPAAAAVAVAVLGQRATHGRLGGPPSGSGGGGRSGGDSRGPVDAPPGDFDDDIPFWIKSGIAMAELQFWCLAREALASGLLTSGIARRIVISPQSREPLPFSPYRVFPARVGAPEGGHANDSVPGDMEQLSGLIENLSVWRWSISTCRCHAY